MYRVEDPVFAMAESSFLDGGSRLDQVNFDPLITFSGGGSVAAPYDQLPNDFAKNLGSIAIITRED